LKNNKNIPADVRRTIVESSIITQVSASFILIVLAICYR